MRQKVIAFWVIWLCCAPKFVRAQDSTGSISGTVLGADQKPLPGAIAALQRDSGRVLVMTALSDSAGVFRFEQVKAGAYIVSIDASGFKPYRSDSFFLKAGQPELQLPQYALVPDATQLGGVSVAARKSLVIQRPDRTIINVDALLSAAGETALDVLQKSPGIQLDQNGQIRMKGKEGITVYIDDRPSYLSGEDLANYLRSLPAATLELVELMPNPPAQYDAAGTGGIINLRIRKSRTRGSSGRLNLNLTQGVLTSSNNSGSFQMRNEKISAYVNASYALSNSFTDLDLNRVYRASDGKPNTFFEQNSYFRRQGHAAAVIAGADYFLTPKTTLGIVLNGRLRRSSSLNDNTSFVLGPDRATDSVIVARNEDDIRFKNGSVNLNYRTRFDEKGHGLTADADYLRYENLTEQEYDNRSFFADNNLKYRDMLTGHLPARIDIFTLKSDYTLPLPGGWQAGAGAKYSHIQTDNLADYRLTVAGVTRPDYDKSNQFLYRENISAAYINLNREMGLLSIQTGLRMEHTNTAGHQLGNIQKPDSAFERAYTSLFPTCYLSYKFDTNSTHVLNMNYGRRIERPYYQDLNPFLYPMDKFTYYTGNPFLKPAFIQTMEASYVYKGKITAGIAYSRSRDEVNETIEINQGIYYSRPGNIGRKTFLTGSVNAAFNPKKWLSLNFYTEYTNIDSRSAFYNGELRTGGNFWFINGNARVTAGKGWDLEISGDYRTSVFDAQFIIGSFWQANMTVQKKLSKAVTLRLAVNDIFYTRIIRGTITNLVNADAGWVNRGSSQTAALTFSYQFGSSPANSSRREANSADAEKNRVKN